MENELKRRGNHVRNRFTQKDRKKKGNDDKYNNRGKKQKESSKLKGREEKGRVEECSSKNKNLLKGKEEIKIQEIEIKEKKKAKSLEVKIKDTAIVKNKEKTKVPEVKVSEQKEKTNEISPEEANTIIEKVEYKNAKKHLDIEALPSTRDFVRFMSLDYSDGWILKLLNLNV